MSSCCHAQRGECCFENVLSVSCQSNPYSEFGINVFKPAFGATFTRCASNSFIFGWHFFSDPSLRTCPDCLRLRMHQPVIQGWF
ncbi:hypothetical protein BDZ89DRAFT_1065554 [Hymenopellis radicata]|nr:hypothetical protein BDZ89DRAFT_1065554 [Hymenopellis radicata]